MEPLDAFRSYLSRRHLKVTGERMAVARAVLATRGHFDVEAMLAALRRGRLRASRATLYRTLAHLREAGLVHRVAGRGGEPRYESMAGRAHHDHMVCLGCDAILEFADERIERRQRAISRRHGFEMTGHTLRIEGYCRQCAAECTR